jgi:hypothetical protein
MKSTSSKPDPRAALESVLAHHRLIFLNVTALKNLRAEFRQKLLFRGQAAEGAGSATTWNPQHFVANLLPTVTPEFIACETALAFLENTPEFLEAEKEIEPLLAAVAALEKAEAIAVQNAAEIERDRREKVDAAKAQAFAKIEAQFAAA